MQTLAKCPRQQLEIGLRKRARLLIEEAEELIQERRAAAASQEQFLSKKRVWSITAVARASA
jgi:hypothetical protein